MESGVIISVKQYMLQEKDIADGCKRGKKSAQDLLYTQYAPLLLGVCMRYIKSRAEAEDVLHDSFLKIFVSIKNFEFTHPGSLFAWMKRITVNTALNTLRDGIKKDFFKDVDLIDVVEEEKEENNMDHYASIDPKLILEAIQNLPKGYGVVFNLYVFEKYSHKEIAGTLGISESTSKTQLLKARKYLKSVLSCEKKSEMITFNVAI